MATKFMIQVCLYKGTYRERWADVQPVGGKPYEYDTRAEVENMARLCQDAHRSDIQVIEVVK